MRNSIGHYLLQSFQRNLPVEPRLNILIKLCVWKNFRLMEKLPRLYKGFPYSLEPVCSLQSYLTLLWHICPIYETHTGVLILTNLQTLYHQFYVNVFFLFQDPVLDIALNLVVMHDLWQFFSLSLFFMALSVLRSNGQVFL